METHGHAVTPTPWSRHAYAREGAQALLCCDRDQTDISRASGLFFVHNSQNSLLPIDALSCVLHPGGGAGEHGSADRLGGRRPTSTGAEEPTSLSSHSPVRLTRQPVRLV